jgi:hypothetical protein
METQNAGTAAAYRVQRATAPAESWINIKRLTAEVQFTLNIVNFTMSDECLVSGAPRCYREPLKGLECHAPCVKIENAAVCILQTLLRWPGTKTNATRRLVFETRCRWSKCDQTTRRRTDRAKDSPRVS